MIGPSQKGAILPSCKMADEKTTVSSPVASNAGCEPSCCWRCLVMRKGVMLVVEGLGTTHPDNVVSR